VAKSQLECLIPAIRSDVDNLEALDKLVLYHRAMGRANTLVQLVGRYIRAHPDDPRGYRQMIDIAHWSHQPLLVTDSLQKLGQLPGYFEEAVAAGASIRMEGDPADAVAYIGRHEIDLTAPNSSEVLGVLVESLAKLGRGEEALVRSNAAIAAHPDVAAFQEIDARALEGAGRSTKDVRDALDRALELEPERASALTELARLTAEAGEINAAIRLYDRAAAASPAESDASWAAIELLVANQRNEEVDDRARALLGAHPLHADVALLLARRTVKSGGDLDAARRLALRAARFGGGPEARATLGWIQLERGESKLAIENLRAALAANLDTPFVHYCLGRAYAASGDREAARSEFNLALASPDFPEADAARAALARLGS